MVPISKVAAALAALIRRSRAQRQPIVITQKGYPSAVLLDIDLFAALRERAEGRSAPAPEPPLVEAAPEPPPAPAAEEPAAPAEEPAAPAKRARGGRKPKAVG